MAYLRDTERLASFAYPNGQTTVLDYFGDHQLKQIWHQKAGGATLSKFGYEHDGLANDSRR